MCIEHLSVDIQVGEALACHQFLCLEELEDSERGMGGLETWRGSIIRRLARR